MDHRLLVPGRQVRQVPAVLQDGLAKPVDVPWPKIPNIPRTSRCVVPSRSEYWVCRYRTRACDAVSRIVAAILIPQFLPYALRAAFAGRSNRPGSPFPRWLTPGETR